MQTNEALETTTPSPVVSLDEAERTEFIELNETINAGVTHIGDLELRVIQATSDKARTIEQVQELVIKRNDLLKTFQEKYGNGSINLETGVISTV